MKNFSGNQWDRFRGLEPLLNQCEGWSILDVGMSDGLVAYEFARRGAKKVHGLDIEADRVEFARRLFSAVPVQSRFSCLDCSKVESLRKGTDSSYDLVLFLAVYQKLERKGCPDLPRVMEAITSRAGKYFALRSSSERGISYRPVGFSLWRSIGRQGEVGPLNIFRRETEA